MVGAGDFVFDQQLSQDGGEGLIADLEKATQLSLGKRVVVAAED